MARPEDANPDADDRVPDRIIDDPAEDDINLIGVDDDQVAAVIDALDEERDASVIHDILTDLSSSETAELLSKLSSQHRELFLHTFGARLDAEVFAYLDDETRRSVLSELNAQDIATIVADLDSDDALDLILPLAPDLQQDVIKRLSAKMRVALEEGLSFPEDSAGRLMQREFVAIPEFWTVGRTVDYLRAATLELPDDFLDIFVITPTYRIKGVVKLSTLIRSARGVKLEDLADNDPYTVPATMDQEEVALLFKREGLISAAVVDDDERLIGVITVDDVMGVVLEEAQEDFMKIVGVEQGDFYRATFTTAALRFRWLFVNLWTASFAAFVISTFSATIDQIVALASLMPIVAGMGGNAGTQALTVTVRALATKELSGSNLWRSVRKEALIGLINGILCATLIGLGAGYLFANPGLGIIIALALVINLMVAGLFGSLIPITLSRMGNDPAVASSVFLTAFTDVIGFFAFLGLASTFLL